MSLPRKIEIVKNGQWYNVLSWEVQPWNESASDIVSTSDEEYFKKFKYVPSEEPPF